VSLGIRLLSKKDIKNTAELGKYYNKLFMSFESLRYFYYCLLVLSSRYVTFFQGVAKNQPFPTCFFVLYFFTGEMFLIVEYIIGEDETKVEVVPSSWYSSGQCWWPPGEFARSTLEKKVSESVDCDKTTWDCYDGLLIATFSTDIIYCFTEIDFLKSF
jgi:hypothetical protein